MAGLCSSIDIDGDVLLAVRVEAMFGAHGEATFGAAQPA
jgi:hypothetical protein